MATKTNALDKIGELQKQIETLKQEAVDEIREKKLGEARRVVTNLEHELVGLTGRQPFEERTRRTRRPSIGDEELKSYVLKAMAADGKMGMNAKQLADKVNQDALRVRKVHQG